MLGIWSEPSLRPLKKYTEKVWESPIKALLFVEETVFSPVDDLGFLI